MVGKRQRLWVQKGRLLTAFVLVIVSATIGLISAPPAAAYSCGDPSINHCYAIATWTGGGGLYGGDTTIQSFSGPLYNPSGGATQGNFIDQEMWILQGYNSACGGACWVEVGVIALVGSNQPQYFWADNRPNATFYLGIIADVNSAADSNHPVQFSIAHNDPDPTRWNVMVASTSGTWYPYSYPNTMSADAQHIGQELSGSPAGAYMGSNYLINNRWIDSSLNHYYQSSNGTAPTPSNPPYGNWAVLPSNSSTGGQWSNSCC